MLDCLYRVAVLIVVFLGRVMADQLLSRLRVLTFRKTGKLLGSNLALKSPLFCQSALPFAGDGLTAHIVALLSIGKFPPVIGACLCGTERLGEGQHEQLVQETAWLLFS